MLKHLSRSFEPRDKGQVLLVTWCARSLINVYEIHTCGKDPDQQLSRLPDWVSEASQNQLAVVSEVF
jgi:hypothetical protein